MAQRPHPRYAGKKLLPQILDELAHAEPDKLFGVIPVLPNSFEKGYRDITYRQFANAVNGMAHWIEANLGRSTTFETLVYFGPHDMRHSILVLAAQKTGFRMLFPAPRFAALAIVKLIQEVEGKHLLLAGPVDPIVDSVLETHTMTKYEVPDQDTLLDNLSDHYAFEKDFEQGRVEPLMVLHTSGSTGFPKPIYWPHNWVDSLAEEIYLEPPEGFYSASGLLHGRRLLSLFPRFHGAHLFMTLFMPLYKGTIPVYALANHIPVIQAARDVLRHTKADVIALVPPQIEDLAKDEEMLSEVTQAVDYITWGGGPIGEQTGDRICNKVKLFNSLGATEVGLWPTIRRNDSKPDQWAYLTPHPAANIILEKRGGNVHEAVIYRNTEGHVQPIFRMHPELKVYPTGDLLVPHPEVPNLWKPYGRADDMLVFKTADKFHPVDAEQFLLEHSEVDEAVLFGTGLTQGALLLQLAPGIEIDQVWNIIEKMNERCPSYAKIKRDRIILVNPQKAVVKTGKGNVSRKATTDLYQEEIEALP